MAKSLERINYRVVFAVLVVGACAYSMMQSLVTPVLPTIQEHFHTSQSTVTWVLTAYLLSASVFTPIFGRIGDMVGKEHMLVATLIVLALGTILAGLAGSIWVLVIARAIQGAGGALLPLSFGIVRDEFPDVKVATGVGIIAAMTAVGGGAGIVLAGPIVDTFGYHWLFWIPLILIVISIVSAFFFVPESPVRTPGKIAWLGALTLSAWLIALLIGVSEAPVWGWGSSKVLGLFALAALFLVVWIVVENRSSEPLIDMRMMRTRAVWSNNLVAFLLGIGMYAALAFIPEFLQTPKSNGYGFGASITESGLYLVPLTIMMFLFGMFTGKIAAKIGSKVAVIIGGGASTVGYFVIAFAHTQPWELVAASTLLGIGLGLSYTGMSALIVHAVPPEQTGVASGMNANIRTIGGAFGAAVMSSIVTSTLLSNGRPLESGYTHGFAFLGAMTVLATLAAFVIPGGPGVFGNNVKHLENAELAMIPGGPIAEA